MQYALLIYRDPDVAPGEASPGDGVIDDWVEYTRAVRDAGAIVDAQQLEQVDTATSVRLRSGEDLGALPVDAFIARAQADIAAKV